MKTALVVAGPDVDQGPLALLTGTFDEKAEKAAELGFDGIELMVLDPSKCDWSLVRESLVAHSLEVPQLVTGEIFGADRLCLLTADEDVRARAEERMRGVIEFAHHLGAMVNIGRVRGQFSFVRGERDPWGLAIERLREVAQYALDKKVKLTIEPINRFETDFVFSAEDGMRLVDRLQCSNVGLMLDVFHMNIEDTSIEEGLRLAGDRLWHVHVADSNRMYPGSGHLDFDRIFQALEGISYNGYVSAEILPLPDPDTAARTTAEFLHSRLSQLKARRSLSMGNGGLAAGGRASPGEP